MSRRHASHSGSRRFSRLLGTVIAITVIAAAVLPSAALAQPGPVDPTKMATEWKLLEYRDLNGSIQESPPGIGVTLLPIPASGFITGSGACSEYDATYDQDDVSINIQTPAVERVACDAEAQAVDDAFYRALASAASLSLDGAILRAYDAIDEPLLTFTSAEIPRDPTIAVWELARIGDADGSIASVRGVGPGMEFLRGDVRGDALSGRVVGNTGCGTFLGSYQTNNSTMRITDVAHRLEDACTEEIAAQAEGFVATLAEITDFEVLPAGLSLEDGNGTTRLALSPAITLGRRTWTPTEILDTRGEPLPLSSRLDTSAVQFLGGKADGRSYCRGFKGESIVSGLALSTSPLRMSKGPCSAKVRDSDISDLATEKAFIEGLENASSHALRGEELELLDRAGRSIMRLVPQAELVGPTWVLTKMDPNPLSFRKTSRKPLKATLTPITATFSEFSWVQGDTGAGEGRSTNDYIGSFSTPGAAQIKIQRDVVTGRTCQRKQQRSTALCRQQDDFLKLLERANGYIVRDADLRLLEGANTILWFQPEELNDPEPITPE